MCKPCTLNNRCSRLQTERRDLYTLNAVLRVEHPPIFFSIVSCFTCYVFHCAILVLPKIVKVSNFLKIIPADAFRKKIQTKVNILVVAKEGTKVILMSSSHLDGL